MQISSTVTVADETVIAQPQNEAPTSQMAKYKENRQKLIQLSIQAREIREEECLDSTINEIIRLYFYTDDTHQIFNTFWEWKDKGYKVKKGEKAFLFWGSKRKNKQDQQAQSQEEESYSFYPLCYVFSNAQVKPLAKN